VHGAIDLVQGQVSSAFSYTIQSGFVRFSSTAQSANGIVCTASTIGDCLVSACTLSDAPDAGAPPSATALDAGMITVTGAGASKAVLTFGAISAYTTQQGYAAVSSETQFFSGGDTITVVGAGGADLPAFAAQSVVAPSEIVLSAPVCAGLACDVDRTQDLAVAWTGGGAGKVKAAFETVGSTSTGSVFCTFDAASGMGTVPKAALAVLGDTRDGSTTGVEIFESLSEMTFTVGGIPTTFSVQNSGTEALMNVTQ
jgi:hypothetical protein